MGSTGTSYDQSTERNWRFPDAAWSSDATKHWKEHPELSNITDWESGLSESERKAIHHWIGAGYDDDASQLYTTEWDNLSNDNKQFLSNLYNAVDKFELKKPIQVNRSTNFRIFGAPSGSYKMSADDVRNFLKNETKGGYLQNDGFMSFSTKTDGVTVAGSGLVIHLQVPPNKGGGAYVSGIGGNHSEREYLVNNNAIFKFDVKSVRESGGKVHVNAKYVGRSKMQTIDSKNKSRYKKEPNPKF